LLTRIFFQAAQSTLAGDIGRLDADLNLLDRMIEKADSLFRPDKSTGPPLPDLLASLTEKSHQMAENLNALTRHFDLCASAVRGTEGGAALAIRRAREATQSDEEGSVSISGVINEEDHGEGSTDLGPLSEEDRAEMINVVLTDAGQVDGVVSDIHEDLQEMETTFQAVERWQRRIRDGYLATVESFRILDDVGSKIQGYIEAEGEFGVRWESEKVGIADRLDEMSGLRGFYESYAAAYDTLILESERRRAVDDKIQSIWRKARDAVDKVVEADRKERERFLGEIGEYLPTDLWAGMNEPLKRWDLVPIEDTEAGAEDDEGDEGE
jgi:autophagy-related protein 17